MKLSRRSFALILAGLLSVGKKLLQPRKKRNNDQNPTSDYSQPTSRATRVRLVQTVEKLSVIKKESLCSSLV
jgi:hypothetical protein